uniref:Uncharacterized protein n=1 Tax=Anguilla anguilla TaxID=7936 RepID=A0A0E9WDG9_ANGAN
MLYIARDINVFTVGRCIGNCICLD